MTICIKCRHLTGTRESIWDYLCNHPDVQGKEAINPVTGETCFSKINDLGNRYFVNESRPYAKSLNTGRCPFYEPK